MFGQSKKTKAGKQELASHIIWGFLSTMLIFDGIFKKDKQVLPDLSMKW